MAGMGSSTKQIETHLQVIIGLFNCNKLDKKKRFEEAEFEPVSLVAVASQLALVGAELPAIKFIDPDQMVYDIIERKVYRSGMDWIISLYQSECNILRTGSQI